MQPGEENMTAIYVGDVEVYPKNWEFMFILLIFLICIL